MTLKEDTIIGASLSEPHTRELGGEISVCLYVCLYPSDFAHELEVKCSRGQVRITVDSKSRSRRFDTGKWHAFFSPKIFFLQCTRMRIGCQYSASAAYCMRLVMEMQFFRD